MVLLVTKTRSGLLTTRQKWQSNSLCRAVGLCLLPCQMLPWIPHCDVSCRLQAHPALKASLEEPSSREHFRGIFVTGVKHLCLHSWGDTETSNSGGRFRVSRNTHSVKSLSSFITDEVPLSFDSAAFCVKSAQLRCRQFSYSNVFQPKRLSRDCSIQTQFLTAPTWGAHFDPGHFSTNYSNRFHNLHARALPLTTDASQL